MHSIPRFIKNALKLNFSLFDYFSKDIIMFHFVNENRVKG